MYSWGLFSFSMVKSSYFIHAIYFLNNSGVFIGYVSNRIIVIVTDSAIIMKQFIRVIALYCQHLFSKSNLNLVMFALTADTAQDSRLKMRIKRKLHQIETFRVMLALLGEIIITYMALFQWLMKMQRSPMWRKQDANCTPMECVVIC